MRRSGELTLLDITSLVHESYLRFEKSGAVLLNDRSQFMAYAARVMRSVVVDVIRARRSERRGGDAVHVELDDELHAAAAAASSDSEVLRVHESLQELATIDARLVQVVEMRYFAGMTEAEIAGVLGLTVRTVARDWEKARLFLHAVWPGLIVTPSSLYDAVAQLRKVLGPQHIATIARKGYRLVTPVTPATPASAVTALPPAQPPAPAAQVERAGTELAEPRLGPRSVAVLPFGAHGLPESLSFLSESLTRALISELSRQPELTVVALGTMLTFGQRHVPPQPLARELGVRFVVDGQLELRADTLHVSVQVADGWRGTQTWADALELPANAWHETATDVVGRLARALRFEPNDLASQAPVAASDAEVQARAFSAQAWVQLFARAQTPETNERATALADRARALAPRLAQAWMCLAYADWRAGHYRWSDEAREDQLARAMAEAERAVELDPRDPDAYCVLSLATRHRGQRLRGDEALRHCLRLAASYAPAHGLLAQACLRRGLVEDARAHCVRAFALSPLEPLRVIWHSVQTEAFLVLGDPRAAFEEAQRGMAVNPAYAQLYMFGTVAAWRLGAIAQARDWVAALREHKAFNSLAAVRASLVPTYDDAAMANFEQMIELLREAGLPAQ